MTLQIDGLAVWLPARGVVLDPLSATLSGVSLVVGRNGRGASTLLRALAGRLPAGARVAGRVVLDGQRLDNLGSEELMGVVDSSHLAESAADRSTLRGVDEDLLAALGVDEAASVAEPHRRAASRLALALGDPRARLILLDQPLAGLPPSRRAAACAAIRARAEAGAVVVWAEHLLEEALPVCDQVLEIVRSDLVQLAGRDEWSPRSVPAPPAMALARALDLPRSAWACAEQGPGWAAEVLADITPQLSTPRRPSTERLGEADSRVSKVDQPLDLREGECLGIVDLDGDRAAEVDLARRLVAVARGEEFLAEPLVLPRAARVGELVSGWERRHSLAAGAVAACVEPLARLDPHRAVHRHSPGERAALAWALAATRPGARLLLEPTLGMDPAARRHVARRLQEDQAAMTCLVSHDLEVFTRACHRLVLIRGGVVVHDGAPLVLLGELPHLPQLARLGARALHVADLLPEPAGVLR